MISGVPNVANPVCRVERRIDFSDVGVVSLLHRSKFAGGLSNQ
jgi:hypothetical protein